MAAKIKGISKGIVVMNDITGKTLDEIEVDDDERELLARLRYEREWFWRRFVNESHAARIIYKANVGIRRPRSPSISWDFWDEPEPRWRRKLRQFLRGLW